MAAVTEIYVNDVALRSDRSVELPPAATKLHVGLVDAPACADCGALGAGRVDEAWGEDADPVVHRTDVHADSSFREQFDHVHVAQAVTELPTHGERDDVVEKALATEGRARSGGAAPPAMPTAVELVPPPIRSCLGALLAPASIALHHSPFLLTTGLQCT